MTSVCECTVSSLPNAPIAPSPKLTIFRDKRPYEYVDVNLAGKVMIRKRTPDQTFGLSTRPSPPSNASNDARGWCEALVADFLASFADVDRESGNDSCAATSAARQEPLAFSLCSERLRALSEQHRSGLIVDPRWGEADLVFPWAVFEVKKDTWNDAFTKKGIVDFEPAEAQIYQAAQMMLAMLDDLVRKPDRLGEYQSAKSNQFQLFGFTSVAHHWRVYVAFEKHGECVSDSAPLLHVRRPPPDLTELIPAPPQHVETLWQGDVTNATQALELLFIVDQIHFWAVTQYRNFVAAHLLPWLARMDRLNRAAGGNANEVREVSSPRRRLWGDVRRYHPEWQLVRKEAKCNGKSKDRGVGPTRSVQTEVAAAKRRAKERAQRRSGNSSSSG